MGVPNPINGRPERKAASLAIGSSLRLLLTGRRIKQKTPTVFQLWGFNLVALHGFEPRTWGL